MIESECGGNRRADDLLTAPHPAAEDALERPLGGTGQTGEFTGPGPDLAEDFAGAGAQVADQPEAGEDGESSPPTATKLRSPYQF